MREEAMRLRLRNLYPQGSASRWKLASGCRFMKGGGSKINRPNQQHRWSSSAGGREMIERRNRQFTRRSKPLSLAMPMNTRLEQTSRSAGVQTGRLARRAQFAAAETRTDVESLEQR